MSIATHTSTFLVIVCCSSRFDYTRPRILITLWDIWLDSGNAFPLWDKFSSVKDRYVSYSGHSIDLTLEARYWNDRERGDVGESINALRQLFIFISSDNSVEVCVTTLIELDLVILRLITVKYRWSSTFMIRKVLFYVWRDWERWSSRFIFATISLTHVRKTRWQTRRTCMHIDRRIRRDRIITWWRRLARPSNTFSDIWGKIPKNHDRKESVIHDGYKKYRYVTLRSYKIMEDWLTLRDRIRSEEYIFNWNLKSIGIWRASDEYRMIMEHWYHPTRSISSSVWSKFLGCRYQFYSDTVWISIHDIWSKLWRVIVEIIIWSSFSSIYQTILVTFRLFFIKF